MKRLLTLLVITLALPAAAATKVDLQVQIGKDVYRQMSFFLGSDNSYQDGKEGKYRFRVNVRPKEDKASIHCQIYDRTGEEVGGTQIADFRTETAWGKPIEVVQALKQETFRLKFTPVIVQ